MDWSRHGQCEEERGALPDLAFHPDLAVVRLHDVFDDGESKPGAALLARARLVHAIEPFEDALGRIGRDARPVVANRNLNGLFIGGTRANPDLAFRPSVFDGVID